MTRNSKTGIIAIGGSTGSMPVLIRLVEALGAGYKIPLLIVVHRMKNVRSRLTEILSAEGRVREPDDKDAIEEGGIYLAPQNYHLLVGEDERVNLDLSELVNYSRPSIDVAFTSVAEVYGSRAVGVLLSGANKDGVAGLERIVRKGGRGIVQHPDSAVAPLMPQSAINRINDVRVCKPDEIINAILNLEQ